MRFTDIHLTDLYLDKNGGDFAAISDDLIDWMNETRKARGYDDLVDAKCDNDVYYDFYLMYRYDKEDFKIEGKCNMGEKDDEVWYTVDLSEDEKKMLLWKLIKALSKTAEGDWC